MDTETLNIEHLAALCMRIAAGDAGAFDILRDLAAAPGWEVEASDNGHVLFVGGAVTSALTLGQDPVTNAVCLNFLVYGAAWPFTAAGPALLERVDDLWHDGRRGVRTTAKRRGDRGRRRKRGETGADAAVLTKRRLLT